MSNLVPAPVNTVQYGDRVFMDSKVWAVKSVEGPDNHGVYDFCLQDDAGTPRVAMAADVVTLIL